MLELSVYDGIPHLLTPGRHRARSKAVVALKWTVQARWRDRYQAMSKLGVRNIDGYNESGCARPSRTRRDASPARVQTGFRQRIPASRSYEERGDSELRRRCPIIVVIVDEMADLMMVAGKDIEGAVQRLGADGAGRRHSSDHGHAAPSVDVITGTIKANFPTRISFHVTSKIDSAHHPGRVRAPSSCWARATCCTWKAAGSIVTRIHGPFVSDEEVEEVVNHLKSFGPPSYQSGVVDGPDDEKADNIDAVLGLGWWRWWRRCVV